MFKKRVRTCDSGLKEVKESSRLRKMVEDCLKQLAVEKWGLVRPNNENASRISFHSGRVASESEFNINMIPTSLVKHWFTP